MYYCGNPKIFQKYKFFFQKFLIFPKLTIIIMKLNLFNMTHKKKILSLKKTLKMQFFLFLFLKKKKYELLIIRPYYIY